MSESKLSRIKFLKYLGLSTGALVGTNALASIVEKEDVLKLNPEQQEFMVRYEKWMDEFTVVTRLQKIDRNDAENNKNISLLSDKAEEMQAELREHLKDKNFSTIYLHSIKRLSNEI